LLFQGCLRVDQRLLVTDRLALSSDGIGRRRRSEKHLLLHVRKKCGSRQIGCWYGVVSESTSACWLLIAWLSAVMVSEGADDPRSTCCFTFARNAVAVRSDAGTGLSQSRPAPAGY